MKKIPAKTAFIFLWHWLLSGFLLGTLTLMGPVRWTTDRMRAAGWSGAAEKSAVLFFIAILGVVSVFLALRLARLTMDAKGRAARLGLPALSLAMFLGALWAWMTPGLMTDASARTVEESYSWSEFVFGPYPEKARLVELKKDGYTAVISLLSMAVVPFEPVLFAREQEAAKEAGIELIHIPMLPWVSSNDHVTEELKKLERRGPGKYYVHCYLGKDRVNVFKTMLSATIGGAKATSLDPASIRLISDRDSFERGKITTLSRDVYFTPYPTDEEFFAYILNGTVKSVVSLLNPGNPEDVKWIDKEKVIAGKYGLNFVNYPWKALDKPGRAKAVREIKKMEKPLVIHAFLSHTPESADFVKAYKGN